MSQDDLVSSFRKTGDFLVNPESFYTMPESTAPATICPLDTTDRGHRADRRCSSTANYRLTKLKRILVLLIFVKAEQSERICIMY